jgi:hypothetical protein
MLVAKTEQSALQPSRRYRRDRRGGTKVGGAKVGEVHAEFVRHPDDVNSDAVGCGINFGYSRNFIVLVELDAIF